FVNTLVLRNRLEGGHTVAERMATLRETALGAFAHQDLPFEKLVEALNPPRDPGRTPLFQVLFVLQDGDGGGLPVEGLEITPLSPAEPLAKFDLTLNLGPAPPTSGGGLSGGLVVNRDLFDEGPMERFLGHLRNLLRGLAADPDARVRQLPLLSEEERSMFLSQAGGIRVSEAIHGTFPHSFAAVARRHPESLAVDCGGAGLGYRELNRLSNGLAHELRRRGVKREVPVGISMERSPSQLVALLAILKAGGTYVPLDPDLPGERRSLILEDVAPALVLGDGAAPEELPVSMPWLDASSWNGELEEAPEDGPGLETTAYVIFTSGSTGRPKGVPIAHGPLLRYLEWVAETFPEPMPTISKIGFDASLKQLFAPLLAGRTVPMVAPEVVREPARLLETLISRRIPVLNCIPSLWQRLLEEARHCEADLGSTLRILILSGDAPAPGLVEETRRFFPGLEIWNVYGPTEATSNATAGKLEEGEALHMGRPIAATRGYVADRWLEPLPAEVPGELLLGGPSLTSGYLDRPAETAAALVPDPWGPPGSRLYRTGDRLLYRQDGKLVFLGRLDHQVKIRGFRIELGEIERTLERLLAGEGAEAPRAVVRVRGASDLERGLVAFVTGVDAAAEAGRLRSLLARTLPDAMVPGDFVFLEEFPMTATGKLDRKALDALAAGRAPAAEVELEAFRGPEEEMLAGAFAEVLGLESRLVGPSGDFFELGGHSLSATRLTSLVRRTFGVELPLKEVFAHSTVRGLAQVLPALRRRGAPLPAPRPVKREGLLPLSFAQQRLWILDRLEGASPVYNLPIALRLAGKLDVTALERALEALVRRHEALRTRFEEVGGTPCQIIEEALGDLLPVLDLSSLPAPEEAARRIARQEASRTFDLARGPLLRCRLLRLGEEHVFLLTLHHIVTDGWSMQILWQELASLYNAFHRGATDPAEASLPPLPLQYADYALWQRKWLSGEAFEALEAFWTEELRGAPTALELPTRHGRPPVATHRGALFQVRLSAKLTAAVEELARSCRATTFLVLEAVFAELLGRWAGAAEVNVGTPVANRPWVELENLVGFFVNTVVLRNRLRPQETVRERIVNLRKQALGVFAHQEMPFEKLVEILQPERDSSRSPLFQAMFGLQNTPPRQRSPEGLAATDLSAAAPVAKFDVFLQLAPEDGGLAGVVEYNADLFAAETIRRLA
ncbi:MAG: amino acid adenylation domain-containing protein, partial [Acidobacteria bacterium]|nr:amino acid adenylation domain-containing protein [Acidobacteriota bacterium]